MTFNWHDYFDLANELAHKPTHLSSSEEARLRSAISRAYYSSFILARNFLIDIERRKIKKDATAHAVVAEVFLNDPNYDPRRLRIGIDLPVMKDIRNRADYDNNFSNLQYETIKVLRWAKGIMEALADLEQEAQAKQGKQPPP